MVVKYFYVSNKDEDDMNYKPSNFRINLARPLARAKGHGMSLRELYIEHRILGDDRRTQPIVISADCLRPVYFYGKQEPVLRVVHLPMGFEGLKVTNLTFDPGYAIPLNSTDVKDFGITLKRFDINGQLTEIVDGVGRITMLLTVQPL